MNILYYIIPIIYGAILALPQGRSLIREVKAEIGCLGIIMATAPFFWCTRSLYNYWFDNPYEKNPITNEMQHVKMTLAQERIESEIYFTKVSKEVSIMKDEKYIENAEIINRIGNKIVGVVKLAYPESRQMPWAFKFILDPNNDINAHTQLGGNIIVNTGLLNACKNNSGILDEDALSFAIAHEVGHSLQRHGAQRMALEDAHKPVKRDFAKNPILKHTVIGAELVEMKFSRDEEIEADDIGVILMKSAGYDPCASIRILNLLEYISRHSGNSEGLGWINTHPFPQDRIDYILKIETQCHNE